MIGVEVVITVIITTMVVPVIAHQTNLKNKQNSIPVLKSLSLAEDKNLLARIAKIAQALRVYQAKVKQHKIARNGFVVIMLKRAVTQAHQKARALALETQVPTLLAALVVANSKKQES